MTSLFSISLPRSLSFFYFLFFFFEESNGMCVYVYIVYMFFFVCLLLPWENVRKRERRKMGRGKENRMEKLTRATT